MIGPRYLKGDSRFYSINVIDAYDRRESNYPRRRKNRRAILSGLMYCWHRLGIQPVFIPIGKPWRNGMVEHFQSNFNRKFFRSQTFAHFEELGQKSREFEQFHNQHHRYSTLGGLTPYQKYTGNSKYLPDSFRLPEKLAISPGYVYLIRLIRSNHLLDVFGGRLAVPADLE